MWSKPREPGEDFGRRAEKAAERVLRRRGYRIVARNLHLAGGEIDLVALDGRTVCFIEVRARSSDRLGSALESVTRKKRRQLTKLARSFLQARGLEGVETRFDVAAVEPAEDGSLKVTILTDAFDAQGPYR